MVTKPIFFTEVKSIEKYPNSETSKCRSRLAKYCEGDGLDLGYAGDSIVETAITVDLPTGTYGRPFGNHPQNLHGGATVLYWFNDNVLDYVYASHLIEDFPPEGIKDILKEWFRVLRPGGRLIIYGPVEQEYRKYCVTHGTNPNACHKNDNFDLEFLLNLVEEALKGEYEVIHSLELDDSYCFDLVLEKRN